MVSISYKVVHYTELPLKNHSPDLLKLVLNYKTNLIIAATCMKNTTSEDTRPQGEMNTSDSHGVKHCLVLVEVHKSEFGILKQDS